MSSGVKEEHVLTPESPDPAGLGTLKAGLDGLLVLLVSERETKENINISNFQETSQS